MHSMQCHAVTRSGGGRAFFLSVLKHNVNHKLFDPPVRSGSSKGEARTPILTMGLMQMAGAVSAQTPTVPELSGMPRSDGLA